MRDLTAFTRDVARHRAADLGPGLDRVAVVHWNTGHLFDRGLDQAGQGLVICWDGIA
jgi:hypothetical protein